MRLVWAFYRVFFFLLGPACKTTRHSPAFADHYPPDGIVSHAKSGHIMPPVKHIFKFSHFFGSYWPFPALTLPYIIYNADGLSTLYQTQTRDMAYTLLHSWNNMLCTYYGYCSLGKLPMASEVHTSVTASSSVLQLECKPP